MVAELLVNKGADKDYIRKDIKPEHQDNYRCKGTVDCGILYGGAYKPREKSAYKSKNKRTEDRSGKDFHFIGTAQGVEIIKRIKKRCRNDIKNYKTEPVPEIRKVNKIDKFNLEKKGLKKIYKPFSCENDNCKDI